MVRRSNNRAKVGIPLRKTLGEGLNRRSDGNLTPLLILFPKIHILEFVCHKIMYFN